MEFMNFIEENMYIVSAVLWILGIFLKDSKVKDPYIPWILIVLGIFFSIWMNGVNPDAIFQGILVAGGAVLADNLIKQTREIIGDR